jgi:sensor histidine kinase YesM
MKSKYPVKKLILLTFWLSSYFFLFGFVFILVTSGVSQLHKALLDSALGVVVLILNGLINFLLLLHFENKVITNKRKLKNRHYSASYLLSFVVYIIVIFGAAAIKGAIVHFSTLVFMTVICVLINSLILVLQNYIIILDAKASADLENVQLKAANADAANQLLRQQIHPHFLFNALNVLKSLYKVNPSAGEEYLVHLSDFLRAAVSTNNIRVIALQDELKLCRDYLEMQKIRFGKALKYEISVPGDCRGYVPSFSIHPLLENTIKHNELTVESPLNIRVKIEGDRIRVENNLKLKSISESSTGSGLANLSERYRILSGDELIIEQASGTFSVSIKILPHEYCNN